MPNKKREFFSVTIHRDEGQNVISASGAFEHLKERIFEVLFLWVRWDQHWNPSVLPVVSYWNPSVLPVVSYFLMRIFKFLMDLYLIVL